jgi:hypothetical protein
MPTFNGVNIFGSCTKMARAVNPRGQQDNAYPGLSGVESLDLGLRGRFTAVQGRLTGVNAAALATAEILAESYVDGRAYTLVDQYGTAWPHVKLQSFRPTGRIELFANQGYSRTYEMVFFHLV